MPAVDVPTTSDGNIAPSTTSLTPSTSRVLSFIETTFTKILEDLQRRPAGQPAVTIRRISKITPFYDIESGEIQWDIEDRIVTYGWPGKNTDEAWRFACIVQILSEILNAIRNNVVITKRDLYYREPELFKKQETVDRYLDDIAHTCKVSRNDLNVIASPKGLVAGLEREGGVQLIPADPGTINREALSHIRWIVVVEKEASFSCLVDMKLHKTANLGHGLLVTGKGYPDLATRQFLRFVLDNSMQRLPIFGLFDGDPDGVGILKCYRRGSTALGHEHTFNVPEIQWLGIKLSDSSSALTSYTSLLPLSARDRSCARSMLTHLIDDTTMSDAVDELKLMLMLTYKVELQVLEDLPAGFAGWTKEVLAKALGAS